LQAGGCPVPLRHAGQLVDAADEHSHGTHVAGIIAGNATVGQIDADGFLYGWA